jgi:hypothetical protein
MVYNTQNYWVLDFVRRPVMCSLVFRVPDDGRSPNPSDSRTKTVYNKSYGNTWET